MLSASDMMIVCYYFLGDKWYDYFYGEFPEALCFPSHAYDVMAGLKRKGWSMSELLDHPIYGYWINMVEYHPSMDYVSNVFRIAALVDGLVRHRMTEQSPNLAKYLTEIRRQFEPRSGGMGCILCLSYPHLLDLIVKDKEHRQLNPTV